MSRSWQGRQFICEPVGHRLCTGTRQRPAWSQICRGRHFECEPVNYQLCPGSDRPGPGVRWIGSSYVGRFGLATPRCLSRRGCPTRQAKIHLSFRSSVINRAIFGFHHTIFPIGLFSTHLPTSGLQTSGLADHFRRLPTATQERKS